MHVFVAGGAGFIGSVLVPHLLEAGHRVTVLDRFYFGRDTLAAAAEKYGDKLRLVRADIRDVRSDQLAGIDALVDLAGISNDPACELDANLTRAVNLDACVRLAETAQQCGAQRIVFASSCSVYGHGESHALTETSPLNPVSLYAQCKADAEKALDALAARTGITTTALRFATLFGVSPRMRFDIAVNVMTKNAFTDRKITVEGGGRQWRPFVHVRDVAECVERVLTAEPERVHREVFNVGSDENNLQIMNLAYRVRELVPNTDVIMAPTDPDRRDYNVGFEKLRDQLDFVPRVSIDEGIREVYEALRSGQIDPAERRWYTLKQYIFLVDVERTYRELAMSGSVLSSEAT